MHAGGGISDRQGNMFNDIFSESVAPFDGTQLVSARAPDHDAAAGTVAPPGQTEVATLRSFSAPLCSRDGGPVPLDSTFLRGQNMVDHEMEQEQHRRHLELQEFIREQMKEKSRRRGWNRDRRAPVLGVIVTAKSVTIQMNTAPRYIARSRRLPTMAVVTVDDSLVDEGSLTSEHVEISAKSDRRRRHRHKSSETSHHGQHNH